MAALKFGFGQGGWVRKKEEVLCCEAEGLSTNDGVGFCFTLVGYKEVLLYYFLWDF